MNWGGGRGDTFMCGWELMGLRLKKKQRIKKKMKEQNLHSPNLLKSAHPLSLEFS